MSIDVNVNYKLLAGVGVQFKYEPVDERPDILFEVLQDVLDIGRIESGLKPQLMIKIPGYEYWRSADMLNQGLQFVMGSGCSFYHFLRGYCAAHRVYFEVIGEDELLEAPGPDFDAKLATRLADSEAELMPCYQCEAEVAWLAPDSRCSACTRFTPEEITGSTPDARLLANANLPADTVVLDSHKELKNAFDDPDVKPLAWHDKKDGMYK